jgi:hypothetical protein
VSDHPVCGVKVGCADNFLMPQPPLLTRRGLLAFEFSKYTSIIFLASDNPGMA